MMAHFKMAGIRALPALVTALFILLAPKAPLHAAALRDLRIGSDNEYVRLVLEFDQAVTPAPAYTIVGSRLQITLAGIVDDLPPRPAAKHPGVKGLKVLLQDGATVVEAVFAFAPADVKAFTLTGPHRFIVDAYRPAPGGRAVADRSARHGFLERLAAPLIVVTSITLIAFVILIWLGGRKRWAGPTRIGPLPPIGDPQIDRIDETIREHLEHDPQIGTLTTVARLSHQKSELLAQRLDDVIAALEARANK